MTDNETNSPDELSLWRRHKADHPGDESVPAPDAMDVAAWLDDRATPEVRHRVEHALAHDPALLEEVLSVRAELSAPSMVVPDHVIERARQAVPRSADQDLERLLARRANPMVTALRWAVAAGVLIMTCSLGYALGSGAAHFDEADQLARRPSPVSLDLSVAGPPTMSLVPTTDTTHNEALDE